MTRLLTILSVLLASTGAQAAERFKFNGIERTYEVVGATAGQPRPLILALHGTLGTGARFERIGAWGAFAARAGVTVVLPDGLNTAWADGRTAGEIKGRAAPAGTDDVAFLASLAEKLVADRIADGKRLYVTGASNGGMMTYRLLCDRPDLFAAGAAAIAVLTDGAAARCMPRRPVPILVLNGTADRIVPWDRSGTYMGTEATLAHFRKLNGCTDRATPVALPDIDTTDNSSVTRISFACPAGTAVELLRVDGGGHQWPTRASPSRLEFFLGTRNRDIESADEIWAFLKRFTR